jgi:pyruvate,water dikinase
MTYTIPFTKLNQTNIAIAGGKGANLGELTTADFPIPPGFVLTTAAYDTFVQSHNLQLQIVALANGVAAVEPQSSETASAAIRQLFLEHDIPDEITAELVAAWRESGEAAVAFAHQPPPKIYPVPALPVNKIPISTSKMKRHC